jgi:tetratricopeptide (TPR) repeat protein
LTEAHDGIDDPRQQAEGELSMARLALDDGELTHAARHVADALACDPSLPEAHELLARLAADPAGGPGLFPLDQPVSLGAVLARAHVLAGAGEETEALRLLISAQCHDPARAWADVPWVRDPELVERLDPESLSFTLISLFGVMGDPTPEAHREPLLPYLELASRMAARHPGNAGLLATCSTLARRLGEPDEAVDFAQRSLAAEPTLMAAVALAYVHRNAHRWAEAEQAFLRGLEIEPDNLALFTDLGELLAMAGRPEDGLTWVEKALALDPADESAFPTACGMRFTRDADIAHLVALADYLRDHPDNGHADSVLTHHAQRHYWLGHVRPPTEAVINVLRQVLEEQGAGGTQISLTLSAVEPPSALLTFDRALGGCAVDVTETPDPDPRLAVPEVFAGGPVKQVNRRLWTYAGTQASPAVPEPSPEAASLVATLARPGWRHIPAAYDHAVGLSGMPLEDLLGVLVRPPAMPWPDPSGWPVWVRSVQAVACLGITHYRADQPWAASDRRAVLVDLAYGPEDWITETAVLALVATAWTDPESRDDVADLVGWRFLAAVEAAGKRPVTIIESLTMLALATPGLNPDVRGLAQNLLNEDDE